MEYPEHGEVSDRELVGRYRRGDLSAFEAILRRYEGPLLRYAARYDPGGAQDIVQEVFLRFVRASRNHGDVENLQAWLYRVARNLAIDESRKEKRMQQRERMAAVPEVHAPGASPAEATEVADMVASKLLGLPPKQRDVLILKIQEEKSYREISEITGLSTSNVGYLIHQGLRSLAGELRAAGIV